MTALNTHKLTPPEGGGIDQPGGGGASEVPGGATGYLGDQRGGESVLERSSQRADRNSCFVPAAEQHWLLHQKPSRQETAGSYLLIQSISIFSPVQVYLMIHFFHKNSDTFQFLRHL